MTIHNFAKKDTALCILHSTCIHTDVAAFGCHRSQKIPTHTCKASIEHGSENINKPPWITHFGNIIKEDATQTSGWTTIAKCFNTNTQICAASDTHTHQARTHKMRMTHRAKVHRTESHFSYPEFWYFSRMYTHFPTEKLCFCFFCLWFAIRLTLKWRALNTSNDTKIKWERRKKKSSNTHTHTRTQNVSHIAKYNTICFCAHSCLINSEKGWQGSVSMMWCMRFVVCIYYYLQACRFFFLFVSCKFLSKISAQEITFDDNKRKEPRDEMRNFIWPQMKSLLCDVIWAFEWNFMNCRIFFSLVVVVSKGKGEITHTHAHIHVYKMYAKKTATFAFIQLEIVGWTFFFFSLHRSSQSHYSNHFTLDR